MHDIPTWFLLLGLFFPRLVLLFTWLFGHIPYNTVPFAIDVIGSIFLPRVLIAVYIAQDMGYDNIWFVLYIITAVLSFLGTAIKVSK